MVESFPVFPNKSHLTQENSHSSVCGSFLSVTRTDLRTDESGGG